MNRLQKNILLIAAAFVCLFIYSYRLDFPKTQYYDEVYYVTTANQYLAHKPTITDTSHPPLGKLLIALSIWAFGDVSWAWRLVPLLCGWLTILVVYFLARELHQSFWFAVLTAFLLAVDGDLMTQSRIAMLTIPMLLWMFLLILALAPYFMHKVYPRTKTFLIAGIFLGMAASVRWIALGVFGIIGFFLIKKFFEEEKKIGFLRDVLLFLGVLPLLIYLTAHLVIPLLQGQPWNAIWQYQRNMLQYHTTLTATHNYSAAWWGWPIIARPIWFFFERKEGFVYGIVCLGNPAIYWLIPFAMAYVLFKFIETRKFLYGFILLGFLSQWLPWAWIGRVKFFYYFSPAMPFALLAVALLAERLWRMDAVGKSLVIGYILLVTAMFVYWYPLYTGLPISEAYFQNHLWFKAWI